MTFDPDDPRLTAFALGELEGDERASVEALLAESPEARRAVEEVRALSRLLTEQLRAEPAPGLSAEQRLAIAAELGRPTIFRPFHRRWFGYSLAAAAALVAGGTATLAWMNSHKAALPTRGPLALAPEALPPAHAANSVASPRLRAEAPEANTPPPAAGDIGVTLEAGGGLPAPAGAAQPEDQAVQFGFSEPARTERYAAASPPAPGQVPEALGEVSDGTVRDLSQAPPASMTGGAGGGLFDNLQTGDARPNAPGAKPESGASLGLQASDGSESAPPAANQPRAGLGGRGAAKAGEEFFKESEVARRGDERYRLMDRKQVEDSESRAMKAPKPASEPESLLAQAQGRQGQEADDYSRPAEPLSRKPGGMPATEGQQGGQAQKAEPRKPGEFQKPGMKPSGGQQGGGEQVQQEGKALAEDTRLGRTSTKSKEAAQLSKKRGLADRERAEGMSVARGPEGPALGDEAKPAEPQVEAKDRLEELQQVDKPQSAVAAVVPADPAPTPLAAERFAPIEENLFEDVTLEQRLSTFSVDVDTASYANVRRYLNQGMLPPPDAVRIEEMVNYFDFDYPAPSPDAEVPFSVHCEAVRCPWQPDHTLLRIGLKGKQIDFSKRKPSNLVFVVDVSGSMDEPDKLPLVKAGLRMLLEQLGENDKIAMVVYAGQASLALPPTHGHRKAEIASAIDQLTPGGSTHGSAGMDLAYQMAVENMIPGGVNRVILATDGDFNVGITGPDALTKLAEDKAKTGVFLNVLGVGQGNLKDESMEKMADKGNGSYHYLDSLMEARKVLVEQVGGTLVTIAKDVKLQLAFNPAKVGQFRLVGYENRRLADRDFADDTKDAGEIGSGHTVTALYELVPPAGLAQNGQKSGQRFDVPAEKPATEPKKPAAGGELLTVSLRYKEPDGQTSREISETVPDEVKDLGRASTDTKFAASVAEFGMILRRSRHAGQATLDAVLELARANLGSDLNGRRKEFVGLVEKAKALVTPPVAAPAEPPR